MQRILYALLALFALIVLAGFALPRFARVETTLVVDAPASVVFAQANDFHRLALWAPLDEGDPDARISHGGPGRGAGATVSWNGPIVGGGRQRIVESVPYEYVSYLINAGEPGEAVGWIALEDVLGALHHIVLHPELRGPVADLYRRILAHEPSMAPAMVACSTTERS